MHHALGLEQHESRPQEEHVAVGPHAPGGCIGQQDRGGYERQQDHLANVQPRNQSISQIEERPIVRSRARHGFGGDVRGRKAQPVLLGGVRR